MTFVKHDTGKNMLGCLPPKALMAVGRVLTYGAVKYSRDNWSKNRSMARYYDAALRHLFAWWAGEDRDPESGESHISHAVCCLMFILEMVERGAADDDRPKIEPVANTPRHPQYEPATASQGVYGHGISSDVVSGAVPSPNVQAQGGKTASTIGCGCGRGCGGRDESQG